MNKETTTNRYFELRFAGYSREDAILYTADEQSRPIEDIKALIGEEDI